MSSKTIIGFVFCMIVRINYQGLGFNYRPQSSASAGNLNLSLDNSRCHAQPYPIIVNYHSFNILEVMGESAQFPPPPSQKTNKSPAV